MLAWLIGWWNWPFIVSFLVGMGLVGATVFGGGHGDHDGAIDGGHDVGGDLTHGDLPHGDSGHTTLSVLAVFGVGKAPSSVLLEVLLVSFGIIGLLINAVGRDLFATWGQLLFPVALVLATVGSLAATRAVADLIGKVVPADAVARKSGEFTGSTGVAATSITHAIGQVKVSPRAKSPDALLNVCADPTWPTEIERGTEVHLVAYDAGKNLYIVRPLLTV